MKRMVSGDSANPGKDGGGPIEVRCFADPVCRAVDASAAWAPELSGGLIMCESTNPEGVAVFS